MLQLAEQEGGRWMAVSLLYFAASVALVIGLPAILTLFDRRGLPHRADRGRRVHRRLRRHRRLRHAAGVLPGPGRDRRHRRRAPSTRSATRPGWPPCSTAGSAAFYLGELLLAIALFRARTTAPWIPAVLLLHVALFPVSSLLPASSSR